MNSSPLFPFFVKHYAGTIVEAIYSALLNRSPDEGGRATYEQALKTGCNLEFIIRDIGASKECWEKRLLEHPEELVRLVFRGLLGREPEPEALATYANEFVEKKDFAALLAAVDESHEHWKKFLAIKSEELINAVYRGLLGREPEKNAVSGYAERLRSGLELHSFLAEVSYSAEMWSRIKASHSKNCQTWKVESRLAYDLEFVDRQFKRFLGRSPVQQEVVRCLYDDEKLGQSLFTILPNLCGQSFFKSELPRILLFGAYGNGNLGDAYQAIALRKLLMDSWSLPAEAFWACSLLNSMDYPFPGDRKLAGQTIFDANSINEYDLLVIGGGGLLAHPHDPLASWDWVKQLDVPIFLMAIGASGNQVEKHADLLNRAWHVSGRDAQSVRALRHLRPDATLLRDPILSCGQTEELLEFDPPPRETVGAGVVWVLKHPVCAADEAFINKVVEYIATDPTAHKIVALEPKLDQPLSDWFGSNVTYLDKLSELGACICKASLVVSMRYHGAIFAALYGLPSVGFSQQKIAALYEEVGLPGEFITSPSQLSEAVNKFSSTTFSIKNMNLNRAFVEHVNAALPYLNINQFAQGEW